MTVMERIAPINLAEDWDNCGLLVGDESKKVKKILITLEPTMMMIDEAIQNNVDLIIAHHPLMLNKINRITTSTLEGKKLIKLIRHEIGLYSAHTNLDKAPLGLNHYLAEIVGMVNSKPLTPIQGETDDSVGLGRIGELESEISLKALGKKLMTLLDIDSLQYVGDENKSIKKIALVTGSGLSELNQAIQEGADLFITGDIKYHGALYAKEMGMSLIDATHFGSENIVIKLLNNVLKEHFQHIEILLDTKSSNPIKNL